MQHEEINAVQIVQVWHNAVDSQDSTRLMAVSDPQIEIRGPRGTAYGHDMLRAWLERAGITLITQRTFARDTVVVLAQHAVWQSDATGGVPSEADIGSVFRVHQGRVSYYARYDTLADALMNADLTEADEII